MTTITAVGMFQGKEIEVVCVETDEKDHIFFIDKGEDKTIEKIIRSEMRKTYPVAGTFVPDEHSMLNIKNVLEFYFFDNLISIKVVGDIDELPFEEGVVY